MLAADCGRRTDALYSARWMKPSNADTLDGVLPEETVANQQTSVIKLTQLLGTQKLNTVFPVQSSHNRCEHQVESS